MKETQMRARHRNLRAQARFLRTRTEPCVVSFSLRGEEEGGMKEEGGKGADEV
jgi:hypothetical protein